MGQRSCPPVTKFFICHTSAESAAKSFPCHTSKNPLPQPLCLPHLRHPPGGSLFRFPTARAPLATGHRSDLGRRITASSALCFIEMANYRKLGGFAGGGSSSAGRASDFGSEWR